ncbi:RHS repeat domain-containing protein [Acinetobacter courvalinii]|uniref:RHS repeat domain-containing protein n=1 Tax=Acinetobacter courvalinii TaxID=280147 RepID=UPI001D17BB81|nr:RHS repeat domain-containing protein [Acinetobacter courvalinii]
MLMSVIGLFSINCFAGSATYTYDNLGRVTKVTYSNGKSITYNYDAAGNRITVVSAG